MDSHLQWAARIAKSDSAELRHLHGNRHVEAAIHDDQVWLKLNGSVEEIDWHLRDLPRIELFQILPDRQLVLRGTRVPSAHLPEVEWIPLKQMLHLKLPKAGFSAAVFTKVPLELQRSTQPKPINLLRCRLGTLVAWMEATHNTRFESLQMASYQDDVLIKGSVLPPISGDLFHANHQVAIVAGYRFRPNLSHQQVHAWLQLEDATCALFYPNQPPLLCRPIEFVALRRSGARRSLERMQSHD